MFHFLSKIVNKMFTIITRDNPEVFVEDLLIC